MQENADQKNSEHGQFSQIKYERIKTSAKVIILQSLLFKIIHVTWNELVVIYFTENSGKM